MAFCQLNKTPTARIVSTYNVDQAVGTRGWNLPDDVMLVQALMNIYYWKLLGFNGGDDPPPGETEPLTVDGICGPLTRKHILHFQMQQLKERNRPIDTDGRLDPAKGYMQATRLTHHQYSLEMLNALCRTACHKQGVDYYTALPHAPDTPATLKAALRVHKPVAAAYLHRGSH